MSSYMVDDTTIATLLQALHDGDWLYDLDVRSMGIRPEMGEAEQRAIVARHLWEMNARAVGARYRETTMVPEYDDRACSRQSYADRPANTIGWDALKCLDCYLYQCAEGSVPEEPLWVALDAFRYQCARDLARSTAAYAAATWG